MIAHLQTEQGNSSATAAVATNHKYLRSHATANPEMILEARTPPEQRRNSEGQLVSYLYVRHYGVQQYIAAAPVAAYDHPLGHRSEADLKMGNGFVKRIPRR